VIYTGSDGFLVLETLADANSAQPAGYVYDRRCSPHALCVHDRCASSRAALIGGNARQVDGQAGELEGQAGETPPPSSPPPPCGVLQGYWSEGWTRKAPTVLVLAVRPEVAATWWQAASDRLVGCEGWSE
jgi:hypothetical protein